MPPNGSKSRLAMWRESSAKLSLQDKLQRDFIVALGGFALFFIGGVVAVGGSNNGGAPQHLDSGTGIAFVIPGILLMVVGLTFAIVNVVSWTTKRRRDRSDGGPVS